MFNFLSSRLLWFSASIALTLPSSAEQRVGSQIRLDVLEPADRCAVIRSFPVSVGLVFPDGQLSCVPGGRLVDDRGRPIPFEAEVTGWWDAEHAHIKWLLLHFGADTDRTYFFELGGTSAQLAGDPIGTQDDCVISIDTGPLRVTIDRKSPRMFDEVSLDGQTILVGAEEPHALLIDDGRSQRPCHLGDWRARLEESTPMRATVKTSGVFRDTDGRDVARLDVRYLFHRGESFVRIYHTMTWMIRDTGVGLRALSLSLQPGIGGQQRARFGLAPQDAAMFETPVGASAYQIEPERFTIEAADGSELHSGRQLGGWFAAQGDSGRAVSVALRFPWQTYPTALESHDGKMTVHFWPQRAERMSFEPRSLMGDRIYFHPTWKRYKFAKEAGHFVNNYEDTRGFVYTAEGASWTHELVIGFHGEHTTRSPAELNAVTQLPIVLRQDPQSAMRVPVMGFDLMPCDPERCPGIERAADWIGRLSMARWTSENNYGLLRFGMVRWSKHGDYTYYRWMDNTQYDQQLIPWLLFMRGGARRFFDDGEITSRYCMDTNVNHYNTRGSPTGYMATCGGALPFPNFAFEPWNLKGMKLHFLAYYYHLTGYQRAKDVMDEIIQGAVQYTREFNEQLGPDRLVGGRENYNMNRFWATAHQETHDPEIETFARQSRAVTTNREYNRDALAFGRPKVYLFEGLLLQDRVFEDQPLRSMMASYLTGTVLGNVGRGIRDPQDVIACNWAYGQTGDKRFAEIGWDLARGYADLTPDIDLDTERVPYYPYAYCGNRLFRQHLMPMLVGANLGQRLSFRPDRPHWFRDWFMFLRPGSEDEPNRITAYVCPRTEGDVVLRIVARIRGTGPLTAKAFSKDGQLMAQAASESEGWMLEMPLMLEGSRAGHVYRVVLASETQASVLIEGPAQVVWHLLPDRDHSNEPFSGGQLYTPQYVYGRATGGPVAYFNRQQRPYTIRDAKNGELLVRGRNFTENEASKPLEAGRMIEFTLRGCRSPAEWRMNGVEPLISATTDDWFDPRQYGWELD